MTASAAEVLTTWLVGAARPVRLPPEWRPLSATEAKGLQEGGGLDEAHHARLSYV